MALEQKLDEIVETIRTERSERKRSNRVLAVGIAVSAVLIVATATIGLGNRVIASDTRKVARDTRTIARDTRRLAVQFDCAINLLRDHPEFAASGLQPGEIEAFDACVAKGFDEEP